MKLNIHLPSDLAIPLPGIHPGTMKTDIHRKISTQVLRHNSQNTETTQLSLDRREDKQRVVLCAQWILLSNKKELLMPTT